MADTHANHAPALSDPAFAAAAVTPNDGTPLANVARALYIGGAGNVTVTMKGGGDVTFAGVLVGSVLPVSCTHVKATGTTATNIIALW